MRLAVLLYALLLTACTPPIYSQFCGKRTDKIASFQSADDATRALLDPELLRFLDEASPYVLQIQVVHALTCNNPQSIALGKDFDGYVRIQLSDHEHCYWRAQQDFKGDGDRQTLERLLERFHSELLSASEATGKPLHVAPDALRQNGSGD